MQVAWTGPAPPGGARPPGPPAPGGGVGFSGVLNQVANADGVVVAQSGDTLIGLIKAQHRQAGLPIGEHQAMRLAQQVAAANQIQNADRIEVGQRIDLSSLARAPLLGGADVLVGRAPVDRPAFAQTQGAAPFVPTASAVAAAPGAARGHEVLNRTLERAVSKGFVPAHEQQAVQERVLKLAADRGFSPDDFARLTLMESDGMNPKASNGSCHGIIQFCDGPNRGAASVGFGQSPKAIMGLSVLQQLDLVDRYFDDVGLKPGAKPVGLDDLYLTVLTPAAKAVKGRDAALPIAGQQAAYLYEARNRNGAMTRNSIVAGLQHNASLRLGTGDGPQAARAARPVQAYADLAPQGPSRP